MRYRNEEKLKAEEIGGWRVSAGVNTRCSVLTNENETTEYSILSVEYMRLSPSHA
jgi:hypothetical protein